MSNVVNHRITIPMSGCNNAGKVNGNSNIPLRKPPLQRCTSSPTSQTPTRVTRTMNSSNSNNSAEVTRWKQKYEESERRRKNILSDREKALRNFNDLKKKYDDLQVKHEHLETELFEKNEEFAKLTTASKNLYREYEILKNQYETETGAMKRVASQWYKENKELKRKTIILSDDAVDEGVDACERESTPDSDLESLNKTIKQLSTEVAELQTELDSIKQIEFQTTEQNIKLTEELEQEKEKSKKLEHDLVELKREHEQVLRISEMLKKQLQELQEAEINQRNHVETLRREAHDYKRERNVLAHQSTILLQGLNSNDGPDCMLLLSEIEDLKRTLEDERNKHNEEISALQEKIDEYENNPQIEVFEERIKLIESELQSALERAEAAEEKLKAPPAPPLPPPPPPPPIMSCEPPAVPLRVKRRSRANIHELAQTIGVPDADVDSSKKPAPGVNEDIINAIKQGKFTLRKAKNENKKEKDTPKAVSELLNILGNLRRAPKKRQSQYFDDAQIVQTNS